jgi:hypothetical protein
MSRIHSTFHVLRFESVLRHLAACPISATSEPRRDVAPLDHAAIMRSVATPAPELPSQRGETWNDTEAINRHREMTPSQRVALALEASRAALRFAEGDREPDERADVPA